MNLRKILRNRIWRIADRIRTKIGEERFQDLLKNENREWLQDYDEVRAHWEKKETSVHHAATETDFRKMAEYISGELDLCGQDRVLDIGCGDGRVDAYLKERCAGLTGFDFSVSKIEEAKARNKEASYFVSSFLEDYKEKCQDVNKVFSYGVMQYCRPEDTHTFIENSLNVLGDNEGTVMHLCVPDRDKAEIYYQILLGVPRETVKKKRDAISFIYSDGSYWHDLRKIKKEWEDILKAKQGDSEKWIVSVENSDSFYRSNLKFVRIKK